MKKFLSKMFVCCCVCLMIVGCSKEENESTGSIYGFVSDYSNANAPIAGATVTLNSKGQTKTTGSDGRFEFSNLEPGTYSISVSANGYQTTSKQVSVRAGQSANCDFQLEIGRAEVDINPVSLIFGKDVEETSFSIINKSNRQLNYTISNYPNYIKVTPASGTIAAKGEQAIRISVVNRKTISETKNGQITVNIGNDSYNISFNIEPYQGEMVSVDVNPQTLNFDKDTEKLTFTMTSNNSFDQNYQITSNLDILTVEPSSGTLTAKGQSTISVSVNDRKNVSNARNGQLTIDLNGSTFVVSVNVAKYEEGVETPDDGGDSKGVVSNGLYAYYTFEGDTNDLTDTELNAVGVNTSFEESFNGTQALSIPGKATSYLSIPDGLVDQKKMSISFWAKDLQDGHIFHAKCNWRAESNTNAVFMLVVENGMLKYVAQNYNIRYLWEDSPAFTHNSLEGWHMITLVSDYDVTSYNQITTLLYIDGVYVDVVTEHGSDSSLEPSFDNSSKFVLGGDMLSQNAGNNNPPMINATKLTIDNFRVYKYRTLTKEEIKEIYNSEKK